ncbi:cytidine deaminase [Nemorincola caseinilytica]|uniref:Cytidine deaminase n=1 Tax=Nemorincola caseinilytica TaxID=2054315 RepID=A0ABP8NNI5_9BACT
MMKYLPEAQAAELMQHAQAAAAYSYSPYSHFAVGAAVLTTDGTIFNGTNVENASYGVTICAERTALGQAIAQGRRDIVAVAVWSATDTISPCGACRQYIIEFGRDIVIVFRQEGQVIQRTIGELLPFAF